MLDAVKVVDLPIDPTCVFLSTMRRVEWRVAMGFQILDEWPWREEREGRNELGGR